MNAREPMRTAVYADAVIACSQLAGRAGARDFYLGWTCPHQPNEPDDHNCPDVTWYAYVGYQGTRITVEGHRSATAAAMALAERLLTDATCRCQQPVTLSDDQPGCRWQLVGKQWQPGCDAPPVKVHGERGDYAAMTRAMALVRGEVQPVNRAERRALRRARGRQR